MIKVSLIKAYTSYPKVTAMMVIRRPKNASNFRSPIFEKKNTGRATWQRSPFLSHLISVVVNAMLLDTLILILKRGSFPSGSYLFKVNDANTRLKKLIYSNSTMKTPERCQWRHYHISTVNFRHISHIILVFPLLLLNK